MISNYKPQSVETILRKENEGANLPLAMFVCGAAMILNTSFLTVSECCWGEMGKKLVHEDPCSCNSQNLTPCIQYTKLVLPILCLIDGHCCQLVNMLELLRIGLFELVGFDSLIAPI